MARVPYLDKEDIPDEFGYLLDAVTHDGQTENIFRTFAHSPRALQQIMRMGRAFAEMTVDRRLIELALLTVGRCTGALYEYYHHVPIARAAGVTDDQLASLSLAERHPAFSDLERAVIRYAEAMTRDVQVSDEIFGAVQNALGDKETVELTLMISWYNFVCRFLEALEVELEAGEAAPAATAPAPWDRREERSSQ